MQLWAVVINQIIERGLGYRLIGTSGYRSLLPRINLHGLYAWHGKNSRPVIRHTSHFDGHSDQTRATAFSDFDSQWYRPNPVLICLDVGRLSILR
jgi:hypothetical protein